jgi:hypothetical protein
VSSRFVRRVRTASGAVAVQVVAKDRSEVVGVEHIGSAHTDAELALLLTTAQELLHPGQEALDLGPLPQVEVRIDAVADWTTKSREDQIGEGGGPGGDGEVSASAGRPRTVAAGSRVVRTSAEILWGVLERAWRELGFDTVADEAFRVMVLARVIEPVSKADSVRVLDEVGVPAPSVRTLFRALARCGGRDYRSRLSEACIRYSRRGGPATVVLYDVTTLHFEAENEDKLRKVGMSKDRRVDPQIQVGLLVDPSGFPLEVHCFEGNRAETKTLLPILTTFAQRHEVSDMVVVADAGMLSAANLNGIEAAGFSFIVGSRISTAPYDLAAHLQRHGNAFDDRQILESSRVMGTGKAARSRRVVYQYKFARHKRDDRAINAMVDRAEKVAAGTRPLKKDRFVRIDATGTGVDWRLVERARQLAGLKGYVTNLPVEIMSGQAVIDAYHDLWQVEKSFRMAKSDLRARPIFHHRKEAIEAHLTVVFAALAISRHLQEQTGVSITRLVRALRAVRSATVRVNGHEITLDPEIPPAAQTILERLAPEGH